MLSKSPAPFGGILPQLPRGGELMPKAPTSSRTRPSAAVAVVSPSGGLGGRTAAPAGGVAAPAVGPVASDAQSRARLERLFRDHHALVWRTVRRLGATSEVAADVTQQAYLIAAERMADIRPGCERSFVFTTAITLARTRHRREKRCELQDMDVCAAPQGDRDSAMRHHYARQLLDRVLAKMDPDLVTVFALFELEGVSTVEMAELFQAPVGTIASRLRRAREQFREEVARLEKAVDARGVR